MPIHEILACCGLAFVSGLAIHALRGRVPITVDESYLWYGALRVREGQLPLRDFRSYEPGRYWWVTAFMRVLGPGADSVRIAALAFYVCAQIAALVGLRLAGLDWGAIGLTSLLLTLWADPIYKLFEPGLLLFGFLAAVLLLLDPAPGPALLAGAVVGVAAMFGLNYGFYLGAAISAVALAVIAKAPDLDTTAVLLAGLAGGALGSAPLWIAMLLSREFRVTLYERRVLALLRRGTTNLPLPIPWPWRPVPWAWTKTSAFMRGFGSLSFVALPILGFGSLLWMALSSWTQIQVHAAGLAAAVLLATAQHHPFSRADLLHLCQVMPLLAICAMAIAGPEGSVAALPAALLCAGAVAMSWRGLKRRLRGGRVKTPRHVDLVIEAVRDLRATHLRADESVLALPQLVFVYPALGLQSPVYDTYCVYPASDVDQARMLGEIERSGVRLAAIEQRALDGRADLLFSGTHPRVWAHLNQMFTPLPPIDSLPEVHFFLRRG
ncbi:MAG: hypothetical protein ACREUE_01050 [Panacagrimonas sp.]